MELLLPMKSWRRIRLHRGMLLTLGLLIAANFAWAQRVVQGTMTEQDTGEPANRRNSRRQRPREHWYCYQHRWLLLTQCTC